MSRVCKHFISDYLKYARASESPKSFHIWTALGMLSTVAQRKVWIDYGLAGEIYPNLYVILVSPPGRARKGGALKIGKKFLRTIDVDLGPKSTTKARLIEAMSKQSDVFELNGVAYTHSSYSIWSDELGSLLAKNDQDLLDIITDLYDCDDEWRYETKGQGIHRGKNVWLSLQAATTPGWLAGKFGQTVVDGGLSSRTIHIVETEAGKKNGWPLPTEEEKKLFDKIVHDLTHISKLCGPINVPRETREWFVNWYETKVDPLSSYAHMMHYYSRKHVLVLKVAILLSMAESDNMIMSIQHVKDAIGLLEQVEIKMEGAFGGIGKSKVAEEAHTILTIIKEHGSISRSELRRLTVSSVAPDDFDKIIEMILSAKLISVKGDGMEAYYEKQEG